ncbi:MAG: hypothetical protein UZ14_CFX002002548 [Chloroflexi bacterium OLB14]|nr:MAG: hypothetical protein UZ14_CFX002002548 [Chloroflexi bacterium OLB14]
MEKLFFETSKQIFSRITSIYDFVWPTSTALWNLRWQVKGYLDANPNASTDDLLGKFVNGSKIHGTNIRRAFIEHSWNQQQEELAKFFTNQYLRFIRGMGRRGFIIIKN